MPVPFKVRAIFDYRSDEPDDLNFGVGQIITVTEEEEEDWYTGEYEGADGKQDGIFPRNFVEKYEPPIPSRPVRPVRNTQKVPQAEPVLSEASSQPDPIPTSPRQTVPETKVEQSTTFKTNEAIGGPGAKSVSDDQPPEPKTTAVRQPPPPVAEKPASSSFKDRIAAFNKGAAAPITPFKPTSGAGSSANFVKKPFVAPPPSRNAYIPPPTQALPPQKIYRREDDPEMNKRDEEDTNVAAEPARNELVTAEDQPKPTSLKDRIALLQQQQLEQAQKAAEKKKVKKPAPPERTDSAGNDVERIESTEAPLTRHETDHTVGKKSQDTEREVDEFEPQDTMSQEDEMVIPTVVPPPPRELVSDTNDADDSGAGDTEDAQETSTEEDRRISSRVKSPPSTTAIGHDTTDETTNEVAEDEEDTEDEDPEVRRRRELRERMAKMSGGMGMMGMFGPPGGAPASSKKPKAQKAEEPTSQEEEEVTRAPPIPIMALPGMSTRPQEKEVDSDEEEDTASATPLERSQNFSVDDEDYVTYQPSRTSTDRSVPLAPHERGAPPPPPSKDIRVPPPAPPSAPSAPSGPQSPAGRTNLPPPPPPPTRDETRNSIDFPQSPPSARSSLDNRPARQPSTKKETGSLPSGAPPPPPARSMTSDSVASTQSAQDKRAGRPPPLPPTTGPPPPQTRAVPPPPPGQPPNRSATSGSRGITSPESDSDGESEGEVTEYDGDYDTDIASSAKHKDALKSHNRDSSIDDETLTDDAHKLPSSPPTRSIPPLPPSIPPRDVPPPPPASAPKARQSNEAPRAVPPPIPVAPVVAQEDDEEYDPYRYSLQQKAVSSPPLPETRSPPVPPPRQEREDEDMYGAPSYAPPPMPSQHGPPMPTERMAPPPPPPTERTAPQPPQSATPMMAGALGPVPPPPSAPKQSMEVPRVSTASRRSAEYNRPSADFGFMASDVDLAEGSLWWTHENAPPPSVGPRTDVLYEVESNTATKRGGKTTVTRDVYIIYMDYSQTTINVSFDANDPTNASLSQSHQRPPPPPRQDQLESVSHSFGNKIATAASQASGTTVADGSAQGFIWTILQPLRGNALMPVGNRSYGATVYSNLANASTQQFDEIRPGDIITFRNAKFAGHKGGLHSKYTLEAGQPGKDHVAVVIDWDGTKKKIRAWEQGREDKKGSKGKVREESFRVGDLKSGEVRVWRIMGRSWVGWDQS